MKASLLEVALTCLVMLASNYSYQFMRGDACNYAAAFERSWFQVVAVLICWLMWMDWK